MPTATQETNGQATQEKPKRERKMGLLPEAPKEQTEVTLKGKIIQETTWNVLQPRKLFSMSADGSHPYLKLSKSSYCDLVTEEVTTNIPLGTAQKVYRIKLL
jgi:hypothetical protein